MSLEVDDADHYYREWRAKVTVLRPPRDQDWGARTFDLIDPFGNTICVMGPAAVPGNRPEAPAGDREGEHSIRVNQQYRITFRWENNDAYDVCCEDYH